MSLLARKPIPIPDGVTVTPRTDSVEVRGPAATLEVPRHPDIEVAVSDAAVTVAPVKGRERKRGVAAQWGTQWVLLRNALQGVTRGFEKQLELQGVGYRAEVSGNVLRLHVGFTHPVELTAPEGIALRVEKNVVTVSGPDKGAVGEFAATIRRVRPPEPYKGKGIRYVGEVVRRKVGKVAGIAGGASP